MSFAIVPCGPGDLEIVRGLLADPSLEHEFATKALPGVLEDLWSGPYADPALRWLATAGGRPAGFCFALVLPSATGCWAIARIGVLEAHRRQGLGTRLLETCRARLLERHGPRGLEEVCLSAWLPSASASGFAARHGFEHARFFWRMEWPASHPRRGSGGPAAVGWPPGIEVRVFDRSEAALRDWNDAYNASFAEHYHYVASDMEHARSITREQNFRPGGVVLAYRDGCCVGCCRNTIRGHEGEIALVGVVPEARGIGLGRALLRWGAAWLEEMRCDPIYLMVDGQNETALGLYRAEGFQVARTREFFSRASSRS